MWRRLIAVLALLWLAEPASAAWVCGSAEWMYSPGCVKTEHPPSGATVGFTTLDCPDANSTGEFGMPIPPGNAYRFRFKVQYMTPDEAASQQCKFNGTLVSTIGYCVGGSVAGTACRPDVATCTGGACSGGLALNDVGLAHVGYGGTALDGPSLTHDNDSRYWTVISATAAIQRYNGAGSAVAACAPGECTGLGGVFIFTTNVTGSTASQCNVAQVCVEMF